MKDLKEAGYQTKDVYTIQEMKDKGTDAATVRGLGYGAIEMVGAYLAEDYSIVCSITLQGHSNWVYSVSISADGSTIVSGSYDNTIKIWSMKGGSLLRTLEGHSSYVMSVSISPDGSTIVSGSDDNTIRIWSM